MSLQIEIGGKLRGIKFTMLSQDIFEEKIPLFKPLPEIRKVEYAIFWAGLRGYLEAKEQEIDFTYEDVQEWVDRMKFDKKLEDIEKVNIAFNESESFKFRIKEIEDWAEQTHTLTPDEGEQKPKKKAKSISRNLDPTSLPSVV